MYDFEAVEKFFGEYADHHVGGNGHDHSENAGQAARNEDHEKYFQGVGLYAVGVNIRLEKSIVDQVDDEVDRRDLQQGNDQGKRVEGGGYADNAADEHAYNRPDVGDHVQYAADEAQYQRGGEGEANQHKANGDEDHYAAYFDENTDEITHQ